MGKALLSRIESVEMDVRLRPLWRDNFTVEVTSDGGVQWEHHDGILVTPVGVAVEFTYKQIRGACCGIMHMSTSYLRQSYRVQLSPERWPDRRTLETLAVAFADRVVKEAKKRGGGK